MGEIILVVKELFFKYEKETKDILKGLSFVAERGKITTILGPNGSGKTTLFKCIAGLWRPYKGKIYFDGKPVNRLPYSERAKIFSIVPQDHEAPFPYSVFDMVLMGRASYLGIFSTPGKKDYEIVEEALKVVGIEHLKEKPYTKISGGERQLTLIARALAQKSPVMLLDEPTNHLDFRNQITVLKKIKEIAIEKRLCVIMTLHDPNLASLFSDKVIVLNFGKKLIEGKPEEILTEELIKKVYGLEVTKYNINGYSLICPVI